MAEDGVGSTPSPLIVATMCQPPLQLTHRLQRQQAVQGAHTCRGVQGTLAPSLTALRTLFRHIYSVVFTCCLSLSLSSLYLFHTILSKLDGFSCTPGAGVCRNGAPQPKEPTWPGGGAARWTKASSMQLSLGTTTATYGTQHVPDCPRIPPPPLSHFLGQTPTQVLPPTSQVLPPIPGEVYPTRPVHLSWQYAWGHQGMCGGHHASSNCCCCLYHTPFASNVASSLPVGRPVLHQRASNHPVETRPNLAEATNVKTDTHQVVAAGG
jgi:hypothetical protein